jgi:hypothetical protein
MASFMSDSNDKQDVQTLWDSMLDLVQVQLGDEQSLDSAREFFKPELVEQQLRNALLFCFLALPHDKRNLNDLEHEFRKSVERMLRELHEQGGRFSTTLPD